MTVPIARESKEYLWSAVSVTRGSLDGVVAHVALLDVPSARPAAGDWISASLVADGSKHYVRILVGPGGEFDHQGVTGDYQHWTRLTTASEVIVRNNGLVTVS